MEMNQIELSKVADVADEEHMADLHRIVELELALVGGGVGVATFG